MRADLDGALIDEAMARRLTREQIRELGRLFASCVAEMAERRAARLGAEERATATQPSGPKRAARG